MLAFYYYSDSFRKKATVPTKNAFAPSVIPTLFYNRVNSSRYPFEVLKPINILDSRFHGNDEKKSAVILILIQT